MSRSRELLALLMGAPAGGFLARPPGLDGEAGLGIAGVSGVARGKTWDAERIDDDLFAVDVFPL